MDLLTIRAGGFTATVDGCARGESELWFLSMLGHQQAVRAIWARLVKGEAGSSAAPSWAANQRRSRGRPGGPGASRACACLQAPPITGCSSLRSPPTRPTASTFSSSFGSRRTRLSFTSASSPAASTCRCTPHGRSGSGGGGYRTTKWAEQLESMGVHAYLCRPQPEALRVDISDAVRRRALVVETTSVANVDLRALERWPNPSPRTSIERQSRPSPRRLFPLAYGPFPWPGSASAVAPKQSARHGAARFAGGRTPTTIHAILASAGSASSAPGPGESSPQQDGRRPCSPTSTRHLLAPNSGHGERWRAAVTALGHPAEAKARRGRSDSLTSSAGAVADPAIARQSPPLAPRHARVAADDASRPIGDDSPGAGGALPVLARRSLGRGSLPRPTRTRWKRGKVTRRMVGRCSCGWVSGFRLHPYGSSGPDLLVAHLRSHELETQPPAWRVDAELNGWRRVHLLAGRVHCASADCHRLGPPAGKRRPRNWRGLPPRRGLRRAVSRPQRCAARPRLPLGGA